MLNESPNPLKRLDMQLVQRVHFPQIDSTQLYAFRELEAGRLAEEPALVSASVQSAGKGQKDHQWYSPTGCLMFSLIFSPARFQIPLAHTSMLGLTFGLAIFETLQKVLPVKKGERLFIHWPNDLYCRLEEGDFRKMAGILLEGHASGRMIAGIGINLLNSMHGAPPEIQSRIVSLSDFFPEWPDAPILKNVKPLENPGFPEPIERFLALLLTNLGEKMQNMTHLPITETVRQIEKHCIQCGNTVTLETPQGNITGFCSGLAEDGAILIDGRKFYSGIVKKV